jgi:hypothetical protein
MRSLLLEKAELDDRATVAGAKKRSGPRRTGSNAIQNARLDRIG